MDGLHECKIAEVFGKFIQYGIITKHHKHGDVEEEIFKWEGNID